MVIDAALSSQEWELVGVLDDSPELQGRVVLGVPVIGGIDAFVGLEKRDTTIIVALGSNVARGAIQERVVSAGFALATVVHRAATVAPSATLGKGSVVMAGAVINADAKLGQGVIINTGSTVDHDCAIGDFAHVAPGVALCGGVQVGARSTIGVGAAVIPGVSIGRDCMVGAGAVVTRAVVDGSRVVGTPAREIQ